MDRHIRHIKRWRVVTAFAASAVVLAACAPSPSEPDNFVRAEQGRGGIAQAPAPGPGPNAQPTAGQRLAISHRFTLRLPSREVEPLQQKHLAECARLRCTVLNTYVDRSSEGRITASSSVRIAPDAYGILAALIAAPPAEVISHSQTSEDKTIPLLDLEKRLDGKSALRDRLTALLSDPSAKTAAELVAIEKELAQVQGDIEAATAQRDYLRTITETVRVDITYRGQPSLIRGVDLTPITSALDGSGRTIVQSVAYLISFLVALVPWLPLIAFVVWLVRRLTRYWRARKVQTS
jgi:uncharacterized protein DUF4349